MTKQHVHDLLDGGDWACAWAYHETLARVCRQLAAVKPTIASLALEIGEHALVDMKRATAEWSQLSEALREEVPMARPFGPRMATRSAAPRGPARPSRYLVAKQSDGASYVLRHVTSR